MEPSPKPSGVSQPPSRFSALRAPDGKPSETHPAPVSGRGFRLTTPPFLPSQRKGRRTTLKTKEIRMFLFSFFYCYCYFKRTNQGHETAYRVFEILFHEKLERLWNFAALPPFLLTTRCIHTLANEMSFMGEKKNKKNQTLSLWL